VFFALLVVAEALAHLTGNKSRERLFDKIGICFFAIAVLAEIAAFPYGQRNDTLSERTIGSLDARVKEANGNADMAVTNSSTALSQSKDALTKAGKAEDSLGKAESEAKGAQAVSSNALTLARDARTEANSFEKDIVTAKKQALALQEQADEIRDDIAWRHVSPKEAEAIRKSVPASLRGLKVEVRHLLSDPEAGKYASEIADALRPELEVDGSSGYLGPWGTIPQGVGLYVRNLNMSGAGDVQRALKAGGVEAPGALLSDANLSSAAGIVIFVWPKPLPASHKINKATSKP